MPNSFKILYKSGHTLASDLGIFSELESSALFNPS